MNSEVVVLRKPAALSLAQLAVMAKEPLRNSGALRAIAFGSYARDEADGYADLDLVVVLETELPRLERPGLLAALYDALPVPLDVLVYTPDEFARGMAQGTSVFAAIAAEGVTIYERPER